RTHLAHKAEHAVDMSGSGAVLAVTLHGGAKGDTKSLPDTLEAAQSNLDDLSDDPETSEEIHEDAGREVVADKGYHGNETLLALIDEDYRTYISEPERGRRKWRDKEDAQAATYANRRRIRGARGKRLMRRRGELVERPFAHYLEAGGMRRTHLRMHGNILKRLLVHVAGFNLGVLMRDLIGTGTPRELAELRQRLISAALRLLDGLTAGFESVWRVLDRFSPGSLPDLEVATDQSWALQSTRPMETMPFSPSCSPPPSSAHFQPLLSRSPSECYDRAPSQIRSE
ncbi:MAG: transposase, partial [Gammaproteobacteria bacterium]|nr:transposase [Gammaproteobacteria bacterium]